MEQDQLRNYWENTYESTNTPFDVENPDEWIRELEEQDQIGADVLDSGCGPGRTAIYLAQQGHRVLGVDISENAIARARARAAERNVPVSFRRADARCLAELGQRFDSVVDIGCFHSLYNDADRSAYAAGLHAVLRSGGHVFLRAFSTRDERDSWKGQHSPHRNETEIRSAFAAPAWEIEMLQEREISLYISPEIQHRTWAWFGKLRRV